MRSSMRAAQGPWLRDENIAPGIARHWRPRTRVITSVYKLSNQPTQSTSPQAKGSSFKPEATSSRILEPGYKRTSLGSGEQATRTNEFFGWDTKKLIWWGDRRTLLTFVNLSSTRNQFPLGAYPNMSGVPNKALFSSLVQRILLLNFLSSRHKSFSNFTG